MAGLAGLTKSLLGKASDFLNNKAAGPKQDLLGYSSNKFGGTAQVYKFPENVGKDRYPHMIKFTPYEYPAYSLYQGATGDPVGEEIYLYMPDGVAFTQQHDWSNASFAELMGRYDIAGGVMSGLSDAMKGGINTIANNLGFKGDLLDTQGTPEDARANLARGAAAAAPAFGFNGDSATKFALAGQNRAVNPRYELLFNATTPRQFVFDFRLIPKTAKEGESINSIIDCFKYYALPTAMSGGGEDLLNNPRLVQPPAIWKIEFLFGDTENGNIPAIMDCACIGIDVSYPNGGAGQFASFTSGQPIETSLQVRFAETNAMTRQTYEFVSRSKRRQSRLDQTAQKVRDNPDFTETPGNDNIIEQPSDDISIPEPTTIPTEDFDIPPFSEPPPAPDVNNNPLGYSPETI